MSKLIYALFFGFWWLLTLLPLSILYLLSDLIFVLIYKLFSYRRTVTVTNLQNAFPEKSSDEIQVITRKFYKHLFDQIFETLKPIHMSKREMSRRFNYRNPEMLDELYKEGKSAVLLAGHYATWQWIVSLPMVTKHTFMAVYKPTSFKEFTNIYHYASKRYGTRPLPMKEIYRAMVDCKKRNELTVTFFLGDQRPQPGSIKYWTTFLNQDTPAITGFERIAKKTDQAVIFLDLKMKKRGYYDVWFRKICDNPREFKDYDITEQYLNLLEEMIRDRPDFWLWTHKRWKHKRPADQKLPDDQMTRIDQK